MPITELRILPPLAIARLGSSDQPLENYDLVVTDRLAHREIRPAETLRIDAASGEITEAYIPDAPIAFRDGAAIRPVAPFLELFARTSDDVLEPLTLELLAAEGLSPNDIRWTVTVGNLKVERRTGKEADRIIARASFSDHDSHVLNGECENFLPGAVLPLGTVRFIKPNDAFPSIRLRYTPAAGLVYGAHAERILEDGVNGPIAEPDDVVAGRIVYDTSKGAWRGYFDKASPADTNPGAIYAGYEDGDGNQVSWGYLDDECDGIVAAELDVGGQALKAHARIGVGPPAFAPDSLPIRTVADELEQALLGSEVASDEALPEHVEEIVRRALETVRLLNTAVMNGNPVDGRLATASIMPSQDANDYHRAFGPIMAPSLVDNLSVVALHQAVMTALASGTPPWFGDVLREPEEVGDLSDKGRRKMPAMMRGADARYLTLTRRQIDIVRKSVMRGLFLGEDSAK